MVEVMVLPKNPDLNGLGGKGGDGGNLNVTTDNNFLWCDNFEIRGGYAGEDFYSNRNKVSDGGDGGSVNFITHGSLRAEKNTPYFNRNVCTVNIFTWICNYWW